MEEILFKIRYLEKALWKSLKRVNFIFLNPVPFNIPYYEKQKGPRTSDQPLFRLQNKFRKIPFINDVLADQVWNYSTFICLFEFGKRGKDVEKIQKF